MAREQFELGLVSKINAEAIGEPGKRSFRLLMDSSVGSAVLWIEKEQLLELSLSIKRAIAMLEEEQGNESPSPKPALDPRKLLVEFKVGKQALEYNRDLAVFRFWNHDAGDEEEGDAKLVFEITKSQAEELSEEGLRVCAAGRPICPLCHQPVDQEGHFCVRSNGHPPNPSKTGRTYELE